jgi:hypothetical protein
MSIVNTERLLLDKLNSDASMALTLFSGTVLEAFQLSSVFYDRSNTFLAMKQITGGSSYQWPILGDDPAASYHNVGTPLNLQSTQSTNVRRIEVGQKSVAVDEILVNALDVGLNDLNTLHFDVLAPFATKLARNIARVLDRKIAILAVKAAATGAGRVQLPFRPGDYGSGHGSEGRSGKQPLPVHHALRQDASAL